MLLYITSFIAGVFTVLAPCTFPVIVTVIGSDPSTGGTPWRTVRVVSFLFVSIFVFTLLLKASTVLIAIPLTFWSTASGILLICVGVFTLFPGIWSKLPLLGKLSSYSNRLVGRGYLSRSWKGDALIALALGPVFTSCSPTFIYVIATVLPANAVGGVAHLIVYLTGLSFALLIIAVFGQKVISWIAGAGSRSVQVSTYIVGLLIILGGVLIVFGYDKELATWYLRSADTNIIQSEQELLNKSLTD